ncbi:hypothetical protein [Dapis sp. BLCC M229]|uniref:hypothetical protein n=1 Tax=Dapis sp. BLCC M229 TaxID=3400188 RepID=UPI003CEE819B
MLEVFHSGRDGWEDFGNNKPSLWVGNNNILALLLGKIIENPLTRQIFLVLHRMKISWHCS